MVPAIAHNNQTDQTVRAITFGTGTAWMGDASMRGRRILRIVERADLDPAVDASAARA